jgi:ATP-dependent RNA helicase DDX23/PRP28
MCALSLSQDRPTLQETEKKISALTRSERDFRDLHWSQKPLDKMTERDWRIFKEDFNITTRGTSTSPRVKSCPRRANFCLTLS